MNRDSRPGARPDPAQRFIEDHFGYISDPAERVSALPPVALPTSGVKLVAHYLPQFYPIPENDAWWGKGFTEWSNVARALPQFVGHHRPHLPADLGFYDLRIPAIQEQQVELAKAGGISAFCFYFYWFEGKTLLEAPIRSFADNPNIDFEFCLCWANEDWSRTWSGNADNILMAQTYSPDDDYAFIAHLAPYLRHKNYLRLEGKPLINVWRSAMLPDPVATVQRWREWCRNNGIGEIHVSRSENYERIDPAEHGMDSAYHHAPSDTRWIAPNIARAREVPPLLNPNFSGKVFDYGDLVRRAHDFAAPGYRVFRSACPSWDNQARRPGAGRLLLGATPDAYREYLETLVDQTAAAPPADGKLVYINAWNEWGEGAHLEPDQRCGFAHLEATRIADLRVALRRAELPEPTRLAIVVHAYHPELLGECLDWLAGFDLPHDVFVTTHEATRPAVDAYLIEHALAATVICTENRGRDVAPFLHVLRQLDYGRYGYVLKLHTKPARNGSGSAWRDGLLGFLTDAAILKQALATFAEHPVAGVLGPAEFLLAMRPYLGRNEVKVRRLAERMGERLTLDTDAFFAGTMFIARTRALLPLAALGLSTNDFEPEEAQTNGTLAHAIERAITYSAKASGLRVAAFDQKDGQSYKLTLGGQSSFPFIDDHKAVPV